MNTAELDSYSLDDAVKFNQDLNPRLWRQQRMRPDVREKLLEIAADFKQSLGLSDLEVKDITVSGSNAGFTYTPHSDIDLHLVVDIPQADVSDVYRELFDAKKYQYNAEHNITIGGYDVELYVENANQPPVSQGVYSIVQDDWINIPRRRRSTVNDDAVRSKYADLKHRIQTAIDSQDHDQISAMAAKIKKMRQAGLAQSGEMGPENLAYKMLRAQGYLKKLYDAKTAARDLELSLNERRKKKKRVRYGYGGYFMPGFAFGSGEGGDGGGGGESVQEVSITPDGVSPSTKMFLEQDSAKDIDILKSFAQYVSKELGLARMPKIVVKRKPDWAEQNGSFGQYVPDLNQLTLSLHGRHIVDVLRTLAHELTHAHQQQTTGIPDDGGETGSKFENEANARAGEFMRHFADAHPEYFDSRTLEEGIISRAGAAAALAAAMAMTPAQAQDYLPQDQQQQVQQQGRLGLMQILNIAKTVYAVQHNVTRAGAEAEVEQELRNYLRAQQGDAGAQNQSRVWQMQQRQKQQQQPAQQPWTGNQYQRESVSESSGYIPTDAEKNDPRFVMALSPDVRPGATGKNANKMALRTNAQGRPQIAKANGLVESMMREFANYQPAEDLLEVKMSTANLRQLAAKTGAQAGMEFEMIVPNTESESEPEMEPDMDQDQRARSFSDVRDFFHDGDYNGRRQVDNLIEELQGEYEEWMQEQSAEEWGRDGVDYMRDFVEVNDLFDRDEAMVQARDEVMTANPDLPPESEDFQQLISARLDELQEQFVLTAFEDQGRIYNDAFETFAEEQREEYDERSFFDDRYQTMSDIQSNFDISWPYYYDINDGQSGNMDIDQVADEFSSYMGKPVNASSSYHGARREAGHYVVEPDGSLEGDNPGDGGLEFVSPPMPIDEMISDLNKVKTWAGKTGCYTNDSTGLHINISVPDYSLEKLDYVKLALLMGDEYVLELFGRSGNTYARAATDKIRTALKKNPDLAPVMMDKMRGHMTDLATKAIHSGTTDKYTSINTKSGYIEFRSPGGDWLDANFDKIENTLLRFTVALSAAIDPQAYRQEYLKKLYKLLESSQDKGGVDVVQLFSNYSAGELDKAALIRQVRQKQLARNVEKGKFTGKMWWKVSNPANSFASIEVVADNAEEAIASAILPGNYPDWARVRNTLRATPLRPYQAPQPSLSYSVYDARAGYNRSSITASSQEDAVQKFRQFVSGENNPHDFSLVDRAGTVVARGGDQQPQARQTGNWGIWMGSSNRFAREPNTIVADNVLRRFPSQAAAMAFLEQHQEGNPRMRTDVEVREIPAEDAAQPQEYEVFDRDTGATVDTFTANNDGEVAVRLNNYRTMGPHNLTPDQAQQRYGLRRAGSTPIARQPQFQEPAADRGNLTPGGPGPWEIYRISDNSAVRPLDQTNRGGAEHEARTALGLRGEAPELYGVRTRQSDAAQGGIVDVAGEQPTAPQTLTRPGQGQQTFTGEWKVVDPEGREIYRFSGVGNNQGDANRVAMDWLRRNPQRMQAGVEVLPVMG